VTQCLIVIFEELNSVSKTTLTVALLALFNPFHTELAVTETLQ